MVAQKRLKSAIVSLVTGMNLLFGVAAIILASLDHGRWAVLCLVLGMLFDAVDGALARKWAVFSDFGAELDSLADLVSFVVANSVLIFFWFYGDVHLFYQIIATSVFLLGGAFRLARFNVAPTSGGIFEGMPTTGVAILVAAIYLTYPDMSPSYGLCWQTLLGFLMISQFRYPKLEKLLLVPKPVYLIAIALAVYDLQLATAAGCLTYVLSGPIISLKQRSA